MARSHGFGSAATYCVALLRLAFASAPHLLLNLACYDNSPVHSTKGTPSSFNGLRLLVGIRFQVLFHSAPAVLFTFPSRYLFTIDHLVVFSLDGWSRLLPTGFLVSCRTQDPARGSSRFVYGALTLFGRPSHAVPLRSSLASLRSFYPDPSIGLGSSLFARRYSGNHFCFLFLRLLRCFSSPGASLVTSVTDDMALTMPGFPIRISADLCFLTAPRSVSPFGASFFSSKCPGILRTPFFS